MLPNLALASFPAVAHAGQLWSIGVEEQFYLFWPVLFEKSKNTVKLIFIGIATILAIKIGYLLMLKTFPPY